ncbi:MAG: PQ-loop domain-containing transporter [Coxiellaceae bacterium]|nr:PQ-loop domain-containing transporter [Coxiellaceae bacterium]
MAVSLINWFFGVGLFVNAMLFIPQLYRILKERSAKELSLIMFIGFCLTQLSAIAYGFVHDDWEIVVGFGLAFVLCFSITIFAIFYRLTRDRGC